MIYIILKNGTNAIGNVAHIWELLKEKSNGVLVSSAMTSWTTTLHVYDVHCTRTHVRHKILIMLHMDAQIKEVDKWTMYSSLVLNVDDSLSSEDGNLLPIRCNIIN